MLGAANKRSAHSQLAFLVGVTMLGGAGALAALLSASAVSLDLFPLVFMLLVLFSFGDFVFVSSVADEMKVSNPMFVQSFAIPHLCRLQSHV